MLKDLVYGWGNADWSALDEYLASCIGHALSSCGPILECGSGLSTVLVGAIAKKRNQGHWTLEHKPEWAANVQRHLDRYRIDSVVQCTRPLKDYGEFCWYDPPSKSMPDGFVLVICDGPPGTTRGGRYGLVPIMKDRLKPGCVILVDDADREPDLAIAKRWEAELGASMEIRGSRKRYIEMQILGSHLPKPGTISH